MASSPVRDSTPTDVPSWLALAAEVEPLFGPMPGIRGVIERGVERGTALVTGAQGAITGGILLSRDDQAHRINWLAVATSARGHGLGAALVSAALDRWRVGDIDVVTFTRDTPGGEPARHLYERFGFVRLGPAPTGSDGRPRDLYRLRR